MIKFGLAPLDETFKDLESATLLVEGEPGCGKAVLAYHLINKALEDGNVCIVVTASRSIDDLKKDLMYYHMKTDPITWIQTVGEETSSDSIKANIGALYTVSSALKEEIKKHKGKKITIYIEALSYALMSNSVKEVYNFLNTLIREFRTNNVIGFVTIETEMHEKKDLAAMEYLAHSVLEFIVTSEKGKVKHGFLIKKKGGRPAPEKVFEFTLTAKGLEIKK